MNGRSPNFNIGGGSNRFSSTNKPNPNYNQGMQQPLHLAPNSPHLSPRGNFIKQSVFSNNAQSPDFIPLGYSSPLSIYRNTPNNSWNQDRSSSSWNKGNNTHYQSRSSFGSSSSSPRSSVSHSQSPYNKFHSRGGRGGFQNRNTSGDNRSTPIASYCDKSMVEDPWADLIEQNKSDYMSSNTGASSEGSESESNRDS